MLGWLVGRLVGLSSRAYVSAVGDPAVLTVESSLDGSLAGSLASKDG